MLKKLALMILLVAAPLNINNGYYQTTKIEFTGIEGTCYGTLLSKQSVSGTWSSTLEIDLNAPEKVISFFQEYEDPDHYFYLNYFQDVSEGLLYWPFYPPEDFKVLLYYPDTDTFIVTDRAYSRYALTSTYAANVEGTSLTLRSNYDYGRLILMTVVRTAVTLLTSLTVAFLFGRPGKNDRKHVTISNLLFHCLLNVLISIYSFRNGFSLVEYYLFIWIIYIPFSLLQGHYYRLKAYTIDKPYFCAIYSGLAAYAVGLLLVDIFPKLFTIV